MTICFVACLKYSHISIGNVEQVQIMISPSAEHTYEEIYAGCELIIESFADYKWCTLYELRHNVDECSYIANSYADSYNINIEDILVIRGTFSSGKEHIKKPYILANDYYDDFIWVLKRANGTEWYIANAY